MKVFISITLIAVQTLVTPVIAGVNGTYRVSGSENDNGEKNTFTGTVKVSNYRNGTYNLQFADGWESNYKFTFTKPLKETTASQTVTAQNKIGTSTATFFMKDGKMRVKFTYKSLDGGVRGQGSGSK